MSHEAPFRSDQRTLTVSRGLVLSVLASLIGPALLVALLATGCSKALAIALTLVALAVVFVPVARRLPPQLEPNGRQGLLFSLWIGLMLLAAWQLSDLARYIHDPGEKTYAHEPSYREMSDPEMTKPFYAKHNCFTCYLIATHLASETADNIYSRDRYRNTEQPTPIHETIGDTLTIDQYQYPPPFLLLPKLLMLGGHDFFAIRAFWYALNVLVLTGVVLAVASHIHGGRFGATWLCLPALLLAPATQLTLQIGNVHLMIILLAAGGMLAFERRRDALGGLLLGYTIVAKLFPGMLVLYLIARRRWRAATWTVVWMIVLSMVTLVVFGWQPYESFLSYQVPRIASGEAFGFAWENARPMLVNSSLIGVPHKLATLGLLGQLDARQVAVVASWVYTAILVVIVWIVGRRHASDNGGFQTPGSTVALSHDRTWLAILILGQLRSPFLPWDYGNFAVLWLIVLLLPVSGHGLWRAVALLPAWLALAHSVPLPFGPPDASFDFAYTLAVQFGVLVLVATVCVRQPRRTPVAGSSNDSALPQDRAAESAHG